MNTSTLGKVLADRHVHIVILIGLILRVAAMATEGIDEQNGLTRRSMASAASWLSGNGFLQPRSQIPNSGHQPPERADDFLRQLEAQDASIDPDHTFPQRSDDWYPNSAIPPGYSVFLAALYRLGNYSGMLLLARVFQITLDLIACLLVFHLGNILFGYRHGLFATWIYALCPPAIYLCISLLPDAMTGIFGASVLLTFVMGTRKLSWAAVSGLLLGIACYFRPDYLMMPAALGAIAVFHQRSIRKAVAPTALLSIVMFISLVPLGLFMKSATGHFRFSTTTRGGNFYQCLGEDPRNPWGIRLDDNILSEDAAQRGFASAWSQEADEFYMRRFKEHVRERPDIYLRLVFLHRLPQALIPAHMLGLNLGSDFSFTKYRIEEGLTRWQVLWKYPHRVLAHKWRELLMVGYSAVLLTCLLATLVMLRRDLANAAVLFFPWAYSVSTICLVKQIEPRNLAPILIVQSLAAAYCLVAVKDYFARRKAKRGTSEPVLTTPGR